MKSTKNIALPTFIIAFASLLLVITVLWNAAHESKKLAVINIQNSVTLAAQSLSTELQSAAREVEVYAQFEVLREMRAPDFLPILKKEIIRQNGRYEKFIVGTLEGHFYNTSGGNPDVGYKRTFDDTNPKAQPKNIIKRDYWQATIANNDFHVPKTIISNPMISYTTGVKQVVVATTVFDPDSVITGMLGLSIDWENIESYLQHIKENYFTHFEWKPKVMLIASNGTYWYHWDSTKVVQLKRNKQGAIEYNSDGQTISESFSIFDEAIVEVRDSHKKMFNKIPGYVKFTEPFQDIEKYLFYAPVNKSGYTLALQVDVENVNQSIDYLQRLYLLIIALICISAVAFGIRALYQA
ncbi:MAG: cache domain-containing protein [Reichenbachiella sp.]